MFTIFKKFWHELNAMLSAISIYFWGNEAEKKAIVGYIFEEKFLVAQKYVNQLKKQKILIDEKGIFKRIRVAHNIYYWPQKANLDSLWIVLAEALIPQHPHYYDSFPTLLEKNQRVLDIGACEGAFCLHAAPKVYKVIAVEPSNIMSEAIQLAAKDKQITNLECIIGLLGASNQHIGFKENFEAPEASMIVSNEKATEYRQCWTLDTFIEKHFTDGIDYIKCDAEGADLDILKSGEQSLIKYKPKIAVASYHTEHDFRDIQNFLEDLGYTVQGQGLFYSSVLHKCFPMLLKAY